MQRPSSPEKLRLRPMPRPRYHVCVWNFAALASWQNLPVSVFILVVRASNALEHIEKHGLVFGIVGHWGQSNALYSRHGHTSTFPSRDISRSRDR